MLKRLVGILALLALIGTLVAANAVWLHGVDPCMVGVDSWDFLPATLHWHRYLDGLERQPYAAMIAPNSYRGPLLPLAALAMSRLFGARHFVFALTNNIFLALLLVAVFGLGRRLADDRAGLLAAFLTAAVPVLLLGSRSFNMDVPLAAMVAWFAYALVRSDGLARWRWVAVAGVFAGLAMLAKGVAFVFLLPLLAGAWLDGALVRAQDGRAWWSWRAVGGGTLALAIGVAVSTVWYRDGFVLLYRDLFMHVDNFQKTYTPMRTVTGQSLFANVFFEVGPVTALWTAVSLVALAVRRPRGWALLGVWLAAPALVFLTGPTNYSRFMIPSYAAGALAGALLIARLFAWRRVAGWALLGVLIVGGTLQIASLHAPLTDGLSPLISNPRQFPFWAEHDRVMEIVDRELSGHEHPTVVVAAINPGSWLEPETIGYYLHLRRPRLRVLTLNSLARNYQQFFIDRCRDLAAADLLVLIGRTSFDDVGGAETAARIPRPAPGTSPDAAAAYQDCRRRITAMPEAFAPADDVAPQANGFSTRLRFYRPVR